MKQTDTQRFKSILESLRQVLEQPVRRLDEIAVESAADALDQVQHASNRELAIRQLEFDSNRLRNLRQAIQRIEDGTYGACIPCGATSVSSASKRYLGRPSRLSEQRRA